MRITATDGLIVVGPELQGHNMATSVIQCSSEELAVQKGAMANALFQSVARCRFRKVKYYLDKGVRVKAVNDKGENVLQTALNIEDDTRRDRMFRYLVKRGAECLHVDPSTGRDVFMVAAMLGHALHVKQLLVYTLGDLDLQRADHEGRTALHHATIRGNTEVVRLLLPEINKYYLPVDVTDRYGLTPYMYAKRLGREDIARILVQVGNASPFHCDDKFRSPDHWAILGRQERKQLAHDEIRRQVEARKIKGRLPPLSQNAYKSKPMPKKSKGIPTKSRTVQRSKCSSGVGLAPVRRKSLGSVSSAWNESGLNPGKPQVDTMALMGIAGMQSMPMSHARHFVESEFDTTKAHEYSGIMGSLVDLMELLVDQRSNSYRTPVKHIPKNLHQRPSLAKLDPSGKNKVSTLAILFGKDKKPVGAGRHPKGTSTMHRNHKGPTARKVTRTSVKK